MQISVTIEGLKEYQDKLKEMPFALRRGLADAIKKSALLVEGQGKINAPVDTGRLRASILTEIEPLRATVSPTVSYAVFVHEGTRYIRSRPFMYDAVQQTKDEINDIFISEIKKSIN